MSKIISTPSLTLLRQEFRKSSEDDSFLDRYSSDIFDLSNIEIEDATNYPQLSSDDVINFYRSYEKEPNNEFELGRILYESLPMTESMASNNLFWVYLNLNFFFKYIKKRWIERIKDDNTEKLQSDLEKFFLAIEPSQNSLIKSPIAGLWWAFKLTVDNTLADKYYYSRIFLAEKNLREKNVGTYNLARNKIVLKAVLEFHKKYKNQEYNGKRIGSEAIAQQLMKTLNQLGGLTVMSYLSQKEITDKLEAHKETIFRRARNVQIGKVTSRKRKSNYETNQGSSSSFDDENLDLFGTPIEKQKSLKFINQKVLGYFNCDKNGNYNVSKQVTKKRHFNIPIYHGDEKGFLMQCYENGRINKVPIDIILKKLDSAKEYVNGLNSTSSIVNIQIISSNALVFIGFKINNQKFCKIHKTEWISNHNQLHLMGNEVTKYNEYLRYIFLSLDQEDNLEKLIKRSSHTKIAMDNSYYKKEWQLLKKVLNI